MRSLTYVLGVALLAGCAKEKPAPEPAPLPPTPPPAPAPMNLADVAGDWTVKVMPETGDSVLLTYTMHATAADTGWTITFPGRKAMPVQAMAMADSLMVSAGPYQSALRKGQMVSTQGSMHMTGGKLMGMTTAHYKTTKPDSVVRLRMEGTKNP